MRERRAREICSGCVVMDQCRAWARAHHEFGFWGGESEIERTEAGHPPRHRSPDLSPAPGRRLVPAP
jgi:hypothetical protein